MVRRSLLDKIEPFNERIQATDWDLSLTVRKREQEVVGFRHRKVIRLSIIA